MSGKQLTDVQLLELLCREPHLSNLGQLARDAFPKWLEEGRVLSPKMRKWIRNTAETFKIQVAPSENLFSSLPKARQEEQRARAAKYAPKLPWEK